MSGFLGGIGSSIGSAVGGIGSAIGGNLTAVGSAGIGAVAGIASGGSPLAAAGNLAKQLVPILLSRPRKIGTIIPDVTIEESHVDRVQVTQHPVATGSPIADHAFKLPKTLTIRAGWSNSLAFPFPPKSVEIYRALVALQGTDDQKKPIDVITISTGKREYKDMVLTELTVHTTTETENALIVEAQFTEVIRVETRGTTQPKTSDLENKPATASPTDQSQQQPQSVPRPSPNSLLGDWWGLRA